MIALCMILMCLTSVGFTASAQSADTADTGCEAPIVSTGRDYGLASSCEDGNILHCFNWTLAQIEQELPSIAQAGFTSIQTSPLQGHDGRYSWYWLYQPTGFTIGNELGSYSELQSLCDKAHQYGIKVIVDVVANHLAGSNSGTLAGSVESALKRSDFLHNKGAAGNYNNRYDVIYKNIGMPDLNSENAALQQIILNMVESYKNAGVDGIRWDAAKHIGLPSEGCTFWQTMSQTGMYQYGEILNAPAGDSSESVNNPLMQEYAQYMGVTDSRYSSELMSAVRNGTIYKTTGYWNKRNISSDKLVYWAESHDTYSNSDGWTKDIDQNLIDRAYAILGAKADSQTLYLSRPFEKVHESIYYGKKGSTHFTSPEVAAVNHFHNAMIGADEKYYTSSNCYILSRYGDNGAKGGAVIVSMKNSDIDVSVNNSGSLVPVGSYVDEASGSSWTVTETKLTGHIGSSGIAVIYSGYSPSQGILLGDADLNDSIEIVDVTLIQKHVAGLRALKDEGLTAADADETGIVDIVDATWVQRYIANMDVSSTRIGEYI